MWYATKVILKQNNDIEPIPEMEMADRRRFDRKSNEAVWQKLHQIADDMEEEFKEVFLDATGEIKEDLVLTRMKEGFAIGDINKVQAQLDWENYEVNLEPLIEDYTITINRAGEDVIAHLPPNYRGVTFNVNHPRVIQYINDRTGFLISAITESNRIAVRNIIQDAYIRGYHPDVATRHIRNIVGLTQRQSQAVDNYVNRLIEDGVAQRVALNRGEEYADRLLNYRAETIARTETMDAVNHAHQETIIQGAEQNIIPEDKTVKIFLTTPDDRRCDYCSAVDGQERGLREEFRTPLGNFQTSPIHPNCRCCCKYEIRD